MSKQKESQSGFHQKPVAPMWDRSSYHLSTLPAWAQKPGQEAEARREGRPCAHLCQQLIASEDLARQS